ncbi:hypothetical protein HDU98_007700 [Podochytrium sp. JEL0797]|nr:hypothetical protein HDU98_007700 [Podochytrium sp. JEL0797]
MTQLESLHAVLHAIRQGLETDFSHSSDTIVLAAEVLGASLRISFDPDSTINTEGAWPAFAPYRTMDNTLSTSLLGFTSNSSKLVKLVAADAEDQLMTNPKESYDIAVSNAVFWAYYADAFETAFTLARNNHHPSKLFFDPNLSPISTTYRDPVASYHLGMFLKSIHIIDLAARWFRVSSDAGHAAGMMEYAKILCSPGWAYNLFKSVSNKQEVATEFSNLKIDTTAPVAPPQSQHLDNSTDTSTALSLLLRSYELEPSIEAAFYIGMIYLTSPSRIAFEHATPSIITATPTTLPSQEPPSNPSTPIFRDLPKASTWLTLCLPTPTTPPPQTPRETLLQTTAAFHLAKLFLSVPAGPHTLHTTATTLLHTVASASTTAASTVTNVMAAYMLGYCLIHGIGVTSATESRKDEGTAWLRISHLRHSHHLTSHAPVLLPHDQKILSKAYTSLTRLVGLPQVEPAVSFALGMCFKFGVGGGVVDAGKSGFYVHKAVREGFLMTPEWQSLVSMKGQDWERVAELFGARIARVNGEMNETVLVTPTIPEIDGVSPAGDLRRFGEMASLPTLPGNYMFPVETRVASGGVYPPPKYPPVKDEWNELEVSVEEVIQELEFGME